MTETSERRAPWRSWWLALTAMVVCGPWPGWTLPPLVVVVAGGLLAAAARPRGRLLIPWVVVAVAVAAVVFNRPAGPPEPAEMTAAVSSHCDSMLHTAERIAGDPLLTNLYAASGEIADPAMPFRFLDSQVAGVRGRTAYLADDRGGLVAWGGEGRRYPDGVRPLGPRRWGVAWSARGVVLYLREPLFQEGRLVGAVTVADFSPLVAARAFGIVAPSGSQLSFRSSGEKVIVVDPPQPPGVRLPVSIEALSVPKTSPLHWMPWVLFVTAAIVEAPLVAVAGVAIGGFAHLGTVGGTSSVGLAVMLLLAGAAVGRAARGFRPGLARTAVSATIVMAAAVTLLLVRWQFSSWLPGHLLRPGWGGVWMVALAWVTAGWPVSRAGGLSLVRRMAMAGLLAVLAVILAAARLPVELLRAENELSTVSLPVSRVDLDAVLPVDPERCDLGDLAPALALNWGLDRWTTPSELVLFDRLGIELSRWGDLGPVGENRRLEREWELPELREASLELRVGTAPWSFVHDWRDKPSRGRPSPVWYAVFTRSGEVAASLQGRIRALDPMTAGELFHAGGGWAWLRVGETSRLARVSRSDEWLVAAVARSLSPSDWVVQAAVASLWALFGLVIALPPSFRREQLATFGGRLRLLVAGGVVFPLVILTLFLHLRFQEQEHQKEQTSGLQALRAARYTAVHMGGGFQVDDDLARWLAGGWGGEVVLFDGAEVVAISRPDYSQLGHLPELPAVDAFISFLLGRDDPLVLQHGGELVAAGAVDLGGRRLLLQLFRPGSPRASQAPTAVDWLLTGAILSALLALALTSRVERRLSASLHELVALARKLLHGEPVGPLPRPRETDLAEVLDAVRSMNEEVQLREISLRHQEELLRITLSTLTQAVVVLEPGGEVRFANPSAERLRSDHEEAMFKGISEVVDRRGDDQATIVETVKPFPGQEITWRIGVAGVPLPDGREGQVAVIDDVSDVVRADRLQQLAQLARIVAHEVKNPLTPIRLWVQELEKANRSGEEGLDELLEEACGEIATQVERLQTTANSFSNLVALERWEPAEVDLAEVVRETVTGLSVLERRGIRVVLDLPAGGGCTVTGDPQWLLRALGNLVMNSVDAIGDNDGELVIRLRGEGDTVVLSVEDTAGGVPEYQLEDLFSPHFSTTSGGSGLGLALVHNVAVRCQGSVAAANGERGLAVRLVFPRSSATMTS